MSYIRLVDARIRASDKDLPVKNIMPIVSSFVCQDACSFIKIQTQNVTNPFVKLHLSIYLRKVKNHRLLGFKCYFENTLKPLFHT